MATKTADNPWKTVSLKSLSGLLDIRSRPADIPPGALRWRQNFMTSSEGKLCTRDGFARAWSDYIYDSNGCLLSSGCTGGAVDANGHLLTYWHNHDLHSQGEPREAITFEFESTASDETRRLFAGTRSSIWWLDESSGAPDPWTKIASGLGGGDSYWEADELQDVMIFCNGVDDVLYHALGSATTQTIPDLTNILHVTAAHVVVEYQGFIFLMNFTQNGQRRMSRVRWCDLNLPLSWDPSAVPPPNTPATLAGFQDLDYGDEILAAKPMQGSLYIYTRRSIWKMQVAGNTNSTWAFTRVYTEPKNQTGCLTYPRTLISVGSEHYYMSRDSIYHFSVFMAQPEREEWTRRADAVIYKKADTALSGVLCNAPCGEFRPALQEIWFSWPSGNRILNNWTLALNIEQKAADVIDAGFTAMVNYRRTPALGLCNEDQGFLCASSVDFSIKEIGGVFHRQYISPKNNDITQDLDLVVSRDAATTPYFTTGYYRILRGMIPLGFYDREKALNNVLLDHDTSIQDPPCVVQLRIGNAYTLVDPNDPDDVCAPQWRVIEDMRTGKMWLPLSCPSKETLTQMKAQGLKPSDATEWSCYEENVFLYYELTVMNQDGSPAIGADSCFERVDFRAMADHSR